MPKRQVTGTGHVFRALERRWCYTEAMDPVAHHTMSRYFTTELQLASAVPQEKEWMI